MLPQCPLNIRCQLQPRSNQNQKPLKCNENLKAICWATLTPLSVHQPTAGAVLPAVHDRTEGVPDRWRSCLERSSIWRYVCSVAGRLWTAIEDRTFSLLLQCWLTVFNSYSGPWNGLSIWATLNITFDWLIDWLIALMVDPPSMYSRLQPALIQRGRCQGQFLMII